MRKVKEASAPLFARAWKANLKPSKLYSRLTCGVSDSDFSFQSFCESHHHLEVSEQEEFARVVRHGRSRV